MASFISGTLLKEEPCSKFMLKHHIRNMTLFPTIYENFKHWFPVKFKTHRLDNV